MLEGDLLAHNHDRAARLDGHLEVSATDRVDGLDAARSRQRHLDGVPAYTHHLKVRVRVEGEGEGEG